MENEYHEQLVLHMLEGIIDCQCLEDEEGLRLDVLRAPARSDVSILMLRSRRESIDIEIKFHNEGEEEKMLSKMSAASIKNSGLCTVYADNMNNHMLLYGIISGRILLNPTVDT